MKNKVLVSLAVAILLCIWTGVAVIGVEWLASLAMYWMLGDQLFETVWTSVYEGIVYGLALIIIIGGPYLAWRIRAKFLKKVKKKGAASKNPWRPSTKSLGLKGLPTWTDLGLAPVAFIAYILLASIIINCLTVIFPWFDASQTQEIGFSYFITGAERMTAFGCLVILAPILEEIIFRGWLYGRLRENLRLTKSVANVVVAIILTSLTFAVLHGQWNVGVNVFVMSVFLCLLRETTGTVYAGILLHMIKNGVAFFLLFVMGIYS